MAMNRAARASIHPPNEPLANNVKRFLGKYRGDHMEWVTQYTDLLAKSQMAFAAAASKAILELSGYEERRIGKPYGLSLKVREKLKTM